MSLKNTEIETYFGRCRCCLSYGYLKNMWLEHKYGEETEVYGEMLIQCFALTWNNTEDSNDHDQICEQCIIRLRDASEFKKVVLDSQEELLQQISAENEATIKMENVEVESVMYSEEDTADSAYTFETADTDTGDMLIKEEPETYEDVEFLEDEDILDQKESGDTDTSLPAETPTRPKRRKRAPHTDSDDISEGTPKSKWPKRLPKTERFKTYKQYTADDFRECMETIRKGEMTPHEASLKYNIPKKTICAKLKVDPKAVRTDIQKPNNGSITHKGSTRTQSKVPNTRSKDPKSHQTSDTVKENANNKTDEQNYIVMMKHKNNLKMVLKYSNATMIKGNSTAGYACCFCDKHFTPQNLKKHTLQHGNVYDDAIKVKYVSDLIIKIDITGLKCKICNEDIDCLEDFMDHLKEDHNKTVYTDIDNHIIPFKFDDKQLRCVVCAKDFEYFKLLSEHMCEHYRNYECDVCHRPFINKQSMQTHSYRHRKGEFKCTECPKIFDNRLKVNEHIRLTHNQTHKKRKCRYCDAKFTSVDCVRFHETKMHGAVLPAFTCSVCQKPFKSRKALTVHTRRDHLMVRPYECDSCEKRFFSRQELSWHSSTHTKKRLYKCEWCDNAFGSKPALTQHMRAHLGDRRYTCKHCTTAYVHLSTWKAHMLKQHGEKNPKH